MPYVCIPEIIVKFPNGPQRVVLICLNNDFLAFIPQEFCKIPVWLNFAVSPVVNMFSISCSQISFLKPLTFLQVSLSVLGPIVAG